MHLRFIYAAFAVVIVLCVSALARVDGTHI